MSNVLSRFGKVVKSEWNHRFGDRDDEIGGKPSREDLDEAERALREGAGPDAAKTSTTATATATATTTTTTAAPTTTRPLRGPAVQDVAGALRVLELSGTPTLDEVRAQHRRLSRHYHPKTRSERADEAHAAHLVLDALTDALELLEEELLPLPPPAPRAGTHAPSSSTTARG